MVNHLPIGSEQVARATEEMIAKHGDAALDMDRLASTISEGKFVRSQRNQGLVRGFPAEVAAQHRGFLGPERLE